MDFNLKAHGFTAQIFKLAATLGIALTLGSAVQRQNVSTPVYPPLHFDGELSVLTYNVKGLPWPVAQGRVQALDQIGNRLSDLRIQGRHPEIIILQEAFTDEAKAIATVAGYRYVADGPGAPDKSLMVANAEDAQFSKNGSWWKGEGVGKWTNSGLQILSDFPITAVHTAPFPATACAGYDCLANKGAMLADIYVEPFNTKVQVGNIHMNSKRHSMVSKERRLYAYRRQVDAAHAFYRRYRDDRLPLIFGGDFNPGTIQKRQKSLFSRDWPVHPANDALRILASRTVISAEAKAALKKASDWQFVEPGKIKDIQVISATIPFGTNPSTSSLSDHIGYSINYRIGQLD